jgi:serine/threonine-protein kinase
MFLDEATLTARIRHPNVVPTLDIVDASSKLLLVMEYVDGISLSELMREAHKRSMAINPAIAVAILCDVLHGLHAAHELRDETGRHLEVIHRDVSPQNVLVGSDGVARILDFGIAKATTRRYRTATDEIKGSSRTCRRRLSTANRSIGAPTSMRPASSSGRSSRASACSRPRATLR